MLYTSQHIDLSLPHLVYPNKWQNISASLKNRLRFEYKLKKERDSNLLHIVTKLFQDKCNAASLQTSITWLFTSFFFFISGFKINRDVKTPPMIWDPPSQPEASNLWNSYYASWESCRGVTSVLKSISEWMCKEEIAQASSVFGDSVHFNGATRSRYL